MHQGEQLGLFLRINNIKKEAFAKKTGMSRGTLYNILRDKVIKQEYMDAIRKSGYQFDSFLGASVQTNVQDHAKDALHDSMPGNITDCHREIMRLNSLLEGKDKIIEIQQKSLLMAERYINSITKKVAHGTSPTKNKN